MIETVARQNGIDILVNNAGPKIHCAGFEELGWSDMQSAFEEIVGSVFQVTHAALPSLRRSREGSSMSSRRQ